MIKNLLLGGLALVIIYGVLIILRTWFNIFDIEFFFKISLTFVILGVIDLIAVGIFYAIKEDEELKICISI